MEKTSICRFLASTFFVASLFFFCFVSVADTLYINGHIRLVDHDKQIVEALYESQRGIAFVGATHQTRQLISDKTKIIEVV